MSGCDLEPVCAFSAVVGIVANYIECADINLRARRSRDWHDDFKINVELARAGIIAIARCFAGVDFEPAFVFHAGLITKAAFYTERANINDRAGRRRNRDSHLKLDVKFAVVGVGRADVANFLLDIERQFVLYLAFIGLRVRA